MRELFEIIRDFDRNRPGIVLTAIEPELLEEKALVSEGRILWESRKNGFFTCHQAETARLRDTGLLEIAGKRVFGDCIGLGKRLVICGGGHVAIPLIRLGGMIGMEVIVVEDRKQFADNARNAGADEVICRPYAEGLKEIRGDEDTFFVVVTRGHRHDLVCMEQIVRKSHAYIGMIGSRSHGRVVREALTGQGVLKEIIEEIHTPIGLNISSETPEEIAVSIIAEIIQVKNQKKSFGGYPKEIIKAVLPSPMEEEKPSEKRGRKVLATIVFRNGSAPREVGTKMVIFENGTIAGTVGGGLAEASTIRKAVEMIEEQTVKPCLLHTDMTNENTGDDDMVCGGIMDILLEPVFTH